MILSLIKYSTEHRITILISALAICAAGIYNLFSLPVDALPDVTNVQVSVVTKASGLSPIEVERFITYPVELSLNGMPSVTEIRSISRTGVSSVTVIFSDDVDVYFARQMVNERLKQAEKEIPQGYGRPELSPISTALGDIYEFVLASDSHSPEQLRTYLDWDLANRMKAVPGVIDINVFGGQLKQYQILIHPSRLAAHNLTLLEILENLRSANLNTGGGYIEKGSEQVVIRGEGLFRSLSDLENTAVRTAPDGTPLLLRQIGTVRTGAALRFGVISMAGRGEVVGATIMMLKGKNSREVTNAVKQRIAEIEPTLPRGMRVIPVYDRSEFIGRTLTTVFLNLGEGALLVVIILVVLLGTFRGALLVFGAIPFSMLVAVIFMRQFGIVGNLMSLGAIDFGLLVDGSVVMLEAVLTAVVLKKEELLSVTGRRMDAATIKIVQDGSSQVARAAVFSIAIIMLVYLPLMTLQGVEGKMFLPMAATVALALMGSLIYTLTVFPAAMTLLCRKPNFKHLHFWDILEKYYDTIYSWIGLRKKRFVLASIGFFILSMMIGGNLGSEFIPRIEEGDLVINVRRLPSISIEHSGLLNQEMEKVLIQFPEVESIISKAGRGESAAEPVGTEETELMIRLRDKSQWKTAHNLDDLMNAMQERIVAAVPSTLPVFSQPIEDRVNDLMYGSRADLVIKIYGDDLDTLKDLADKIGDIIRPIRGAADVRVARIRGLPLMEIKSNRQKMARYGVQTREILNTVEALRVGAPAGKVFEGLRSFDLIVRLDAGAYNSSMVENIPIMTEKGTTVPLGQIADIEFREGNAVIFREALRRRVNVESNVRGRDLGSFVAEVQEQTESILRRLPQGYYVDWGGQFENFIRARNRLLIVAPVIMGIIFAMLIATFGNIKYALGVFSTVPFAIAGGILGLFVRGMTFSIPAGVGFIAVSGISVLTGIVYSSYLKKLIESGEDTQGAAVQAGRMSLRAVITTELIAAIGFFPMALSTRAGAEVQRPLATVVIGGILASTLLCQFLLPIVLQTLLRKRDDF